MSIVPEARIGAIAAPLMAVAIGVALTLLAFFPGLMSVDSAVQYAQARGALPLDDVHPPLMVLLWRALQRVAAGPAPLFLVFVVAWWGGLAAFAWQIAPTRRRRWMLLFALGLWPATFLMLGHLWKDVAMAAALLLASAATLAWHRRRQRRWFALAALVLLAACALRHNGVFATLPLLAWLCWPLRARSLALALGLTLACVALPVGLQRLAGAIPVQPWSVVALWDLAAISLQTGEVLIPPALQRRPVTLHELRDSYSPYANPPLFASGAVRLSFYQPLDPDEQRLLRDAWWTAVRAHPAAYLRHRAALGRYLLFGFPADLPRELVYVPARISLPEAPLALAPVDESTPLWRAAAALRTTPLFAGFVYLALSVLATTLALRRDIGRLHRGAACALAASAWANALPLFAISGSAEFRYLAWTALASLCALACASVGRRRDLG